MVSWPRVMATIRLLPPPPPRTTSARRSQRKHRRHPPTPARVSQTRQTMQTAIDQRRKQKKRQQKIIPHNIRLCAKYAAAPTKTGNYILGGGGGLTLTRNRKTRDTENVEEVVAGSIERAWDANLLNCLLVCCTIRFTIPPGKCVMENA